MSTKLDTAALRKLLAEATPRPWSQTRDVKRGVKIWGGAAEALFESIHGLNASRVSPADPVPRWQKDCDLVLSLVKAAPALLDAADERDKLVEMRFAPTGDNHHNAAACPYCSESLCKEQDAASRAADAIARERDIARQQRDASLAEIERRGEEIVRLRESNVADARMMVQKHEALRRDRDEIRDERDRLRAALAALTPKPDLSGQLASAEAALRLYIHGDPSGARLHFGVFPSSEPILWPVNDPPEALAPKPERFDAAAACAAIVPNGLNGPCATCDALRTAYAQGWKDAPENDRAQVERLLKVRDEQQARISAALAHRGLASASHRMTVGNETRYLECRGPEGWKCDDTCWACLREALSASPPKPEPADRCPCEPNCDEGNCSDCADGVRRYCRNCEDGRALSEPKPEQPKPDPLAESLVAKACVTAPKPTLGPLDADGIHFLGELRETDAPLGTCDWGGCDEPSVRERFDGREWLPVCGACSMRPIEPHGFEPNAGGGNLGE